MTDSRRAPPRAAGAALESDPECNRIAEVSARSSENAAKAAPLGGVFWDGGAETFIHKGNGRWRDVLTADDNAKYGARAHAELGAEAARWLATGELPASLTRAA